MVISFQLCIKLGRAQWDRDIGMHVCGLGNWGRKGKGMWGRGDIWDVWDAGTSNIGNTGGKVGGKCDISFFVKMCYLRSILTAFDSK